MLGAMPTLAWACFFGWHLQAQLVGGHSERSEESLTSNFSLLPSPCRHKNKPNFKTQKTLILYQKRRNGGQKTIQKNETNPFVDNFQGSTAAPGCGSVIPDLTRNPDYSPFTTCGEQSRTIDYSLVRAFCLFPFAFFLKKMYNLTGF